ncbi:unnamed protein product [Penicillium pancosmium]
MDAKEIETKAKALTKAAAADEPTSTMIGMLKELQTGVRASESLLRSTRIASEIVSKWRTEVNKQKQAGGSAASRASSSPRPAQNGSTGASTPAGTTPTDKTSKLSVPPDKRTWKADKVDTNVTTSKVRDSCIGLMYDGLCLGSTESPKDVLKKAISVEGAAYDALGPDTKEAYRTKMRSLFQNLKNKNNVSLRKRVLEGDIKPDYFIRMTSDELRSDAQREADEKIKKMNMNNAMVAQGEKSISTSLQCGKCGQRKVTYTEAQTRAADEPMTLFCTCLNCGKSWKQ